MTTFNSEGPIMKLLGNTKDQNITRKILGTKMEFRVNIRFQNRVLALN